MSVLRNRWAQSALVVALERPLYSVDRCLVGLVEHSGGRMRAITVIAPEGQVFLEMDKARFGAFFRALQDYDMLELLEGQEVSAACPGMLLAFLA